MTRRRLIVLAVVYLLCGFVVNVLVAWGLAVQPVSYNRLVAYGRAVTEWQEIQYEESQGEWIWRGRGLCDSLRAVARYPRVAETLVGGFIALRDSVIVDAMVIQTRHHPGSDGGYTVTVIQLENGVQLDYVGYLGEAPNHVPVRVNRARDRVVYTALAYWIPTIIPSVIAIVMLMGWIWITRASVVRGAGCA